MPHLVPRMEFLDALFAPYFKDCDGFILVQSRVRQETKTSTRYFPKIAALGREIYPDDHNVFFGVCARERMRPEKEHIQYLTALWAGLDIGPDGYSGKEKYFSNERMAMIAIKNFPLPPSIVVHSGHGRQLYWLLDEAHAVRNVEEIENLLSRINGYFQCTRPVGLDSTMRLPDTTNYRNPTESFYCHVEHFDPKARYDLDQFRGLDLRIILPSKRRPVAPMVPPPVVAPKRIRVVDEITGIEITGGPSCPLTASPPEPVVGIASQPEPTPTGIEMDEMAARFVNAFSGPLLDALADKIADRILAKLQQRVK